MTTRRSSGAQEQGLLVDEADGVAEWVAGPEHPLAPGHLLDAALEYLAAGLDGAGQGGLEVGDSEVEVLVGVGRPATWPVTVGGRVEMEVIDDGPGISEALRAQIFEPFFTTRAGGTGLGLYIARELCEANGASLELEEANPGAHFRIFAQGET